MRRALVTGGTGFIGRRLCAELSSRGVAVRATARNASTGPWEEFRTFDLRHGSSLAGVVKGVDTVFHLAALVHVSNGRKDRAEQWAVNAEGTDRLLRAACAEGVERFVYFGSVKAVGNPGHCCSDETVESSPTTAYGEAKRAAERLVQGAAAAEVIQASVIRPSLVYGPGCKGNISRMLTAVRRGVFPPLPDVRNRRSMVHVDDVVAAALLAEARADTSAQPYILTDGEEYSTRRIYEAMCLALGRRPAHWTIPPITLDLASKGAATLERLSRHRLSAASSMMDRLLGSEYYDSSRARNLLGWKPTYTLESALPDMVAL